MEDKSKYYTPEIEEFHVGFEYEYRDEPFKTWTKDIFKDGESIELHDEYRVKHLDRELIESLGFEHENWVYPSNKTHWFVNQTRNTGSRRNAIWIGTEYHYRTKQVLIFRGESPKDMFRNKKGNILFEGTIKNKSELKRILKMIGV
jgi:hypothetical protein